MITPPDDYLVLEVRRLFGGVAVTIISVAPNNAQTHYQLLMGVPSNLLWEYLHTHILSTKERTNMCRLEEKRWSALSLNI